MLRRRGTKINFRRGIPVFIRYNPAVNSPPRVHHLSIHAHSGLATIRIGAKPGEQNSPANSANSAIDDWLTGFRLDPFVHRHVAMVIALIPDEVRDDLMSDRAFHLCDYEPGPGVVMQVPMRLPQRNRASRSVVLKRTLRYRSESFVKWLIAHEFAHAHLRHGGRFPGEDPEHAADALAAEWGFPKPRTG
jgi:hypothetical protein